MKSRISVATAIAALASLTACTALTLSQLSGTDLAVVDGGVDNSSSGSPNTSDIDAGPCSLLVDQEGTDTLVLPDNTCADCISTKCGSQVSFACNGGTEPKSWFENLKACAQQPYQKYGPPEAGPDSFEWGCTRYLSPGPPFTSDLDSDPAKEQDSEICVSNNCLQGDTPPCKQCTVSIPKNPNSGNGYDVSFLSDDPCGKCFTPCIKDLVACCGSSPMDDFVKYCAYTSLPANAKICEQLGNGEAFDASGPAGAYNNPTDTTCLQKLSQCFIANCATIGSCNTH